MNIENIDTLIKYMKSGKTPFSMHTSKKCLMGQAIASQGEVFEFHSREEVARKILGLTLGEAGAMFQQSTTVGLLFPITLEDAVAMLETFKDTGEVYWPKTFDLPSYNAQGNRLCV